MDCVLCHYFIPTFSFCSYSTKHLGDLLKQLLKVSVSDAVKSQSYNIAHYSWGEITNLMSKWYLTISPSVSVSATLSSGWWPRCSYQPKNKLTQDPKLGKTGTRKLGMFYSWVLCFYFYNSTFLLFISLDHRLLSQRCVN